MSVLVSVLAVVILVIDFLVFNPVCHFQECCIDKYLPYNVSKFNDDLRLKLIGQPLVMQLSDIIEGHRVNLDTGTNEKPLVLSFHGWTGVGKNYVASILVDAFFVKGIKSDYVKMYVGQDDFPQASKVDHYKVKLKNEVAQIVKSCPEAMFIFDEVHMMPPDVLDALMPLMGLYPSVNGVDYRRAIFIFISNIGSEEIGATLLNLYENGYTRENATLAHFEKSVRAAAYTKGGFKDSPLIFQHIVDHYIPFLPLEQAHVEKCTKIAFAARGVRNPTTEMIDEAMSINVYGPSKMKPIFVSSGCKRVRQQVNKVIAAHSKKKK